MQWQELLFFRSSLMTSSEQMPCTPVGKELSSDLPVLATANPFFTESNLPKDSHVHSCTCWACDTGTMQKKIDGDPDIQRAPNIHRVPDNLPDFFFAITARRLGTNLVREAIINSSQLPGVSSAPFNWLLS